MNYQNLLLEIENNITVVSINRPDKLNALNNQTLAELSDLISSLQSDSEVAVIIITGAGKKAFVAGADIKEINKLDMITAKEFSENGQAVFNSIENSDKPVIAAVNGFALGGGCELALACHIRIASEEAKFGQPEINLGIIPGYGGTQRLARLVNTGIAMEIILTGDMISALEALRIGLVNKVYPAGDLLDKAKELASKIAGKGEQSIKQAINSIRMTNEVFLKEGLKYEAGSFSICCGTEDFKEGTSAFLEKRKPEFKNR